MPAWSDGGVAVDDCKLGQSRGSPAAVRDAGQDALVQASTCDRAPQSGRVDQLGTNVAGSVGARRCQHGRVCTNPPRSRRMAGENGTPTDSHQRADVDHLAAGDRRSSLRDAQLDISSCVTFAADHIRHSR